MDYKITGTNYDGTPIKQPIWESMTADERTAYAKEALTMSAKGKDLVAIHADGSLTGLMNGNPIVNKSAKPPKDAAISSALRKVIP